MDQMFKMIASGKIDDSWSKFVERYAWPMVSKAGGIMIQQMVDNLKSGVLGMVGQRTKQANYHNNRSCELCVFHCEFCV